MVDSTLGTNDHYINPIDNNRPVIPSRQVGVTRIFDEDVETPEMELLDGGGAQGGWARSMGRVA